jgi:peptidoglycan/LPS O-acetylase OafA/YrhL
MQPQRRFFTTLDGIRGVAAIMVVAYHAAPAFGKGIAHEQFLAVDLFFVLSGVVIANAYEHRLRSGLSVSSFTRIRIIRLYPLYIFGTAIRLIAIGAGLILVGSRSAGNGHQLAAALILAILMLPDPFGDLVFPLNPPGWSLFFELLGNIAYASVFRLLKPYVLGAIMAVSALGLAGFLYFGPQHDLDIGGTAENLTGGFFRVGYSFFAGVLLFRLFASQKGTVKDDRRVAFMPWIILGLVAVMLGAKPQASIRPYYEFAVVTLFFPAIIYCALWFEPTGVGERVCKFLGAVSYAVYAIHLPLFHWLISGKTERMLHVSVESWAPWAGICFVGLLLAFCWALDKFYDRPLRSFLLARGQLRTATIPKKA